MGAESNAGYLKVEWTSNGCCATVRLEGEVDIASVDQVRAATREAREHDGVVHLTVDCEQLDFLDSSGVKALLEAHDSFDGRVALLKPRRVVTRVFEVTGLDQLFRIADSPEGARDIIHDM